MKETSDDKEKHKIVYQTFGDVRVSISYNQFLIKIRVIARILVSFITEVPSIPKLSQCWVITFNFFRSKATSAFRIWIESERWKFSGPNCKRKIHFAKKWTWINMVPLSSNLPQDFSSNCGFKMIPPICQKVLSKSQSFACLRYLGFVTSRKTKPLHALRFLQSLLKCDISDI